MLFFLLPLTSVGRLLCYINGDILASTPHTPHMMLDLGSYLARMDLILATIPISSDLKSPSQPSPLSDIPSPRLNIGELLSPAALSNASVWSMDVCDETVLTYFGELADEARRETVSKITKFYIESMKDIVLGEANSSDFPKQFIHADANDYNLIADHKKEKISAILDFGDLGISRRIYDLSTCAAYMLLDVAPEKYDSYCKMLSQGKTEAVCPEFAVIHCLIKGFNEIYPLNQVEVECILILALMRLCVSVVMSNHTYTLNPGNEYLLVTSKPGWKVLIGILERFKTVEAAQGAFLSQVVSNFFG